MSDDERSEAEKALRRKYALLRKKKAQAAVNKNRPVSTKTNDIDKVDPVRQAAIAALKAKRAAEAGTLAGELPAPAPALAAAKPTAAVVSKTSDGSMKLKFVLAKKEQTADITAATQPKPQTGEVLPPQTTTTTTTTTATATDTKRQTLKRPAARPKTNVATTGDYDTQGDAKRMRQSTDDHMQHAAHHQEHEEQHAMHSEPILWVGQLPEHYTDDDLWNVFGEFNNVEEVHVLQEYCSGLVTFGSFDDAHSVMEFAESNGGIEIEDRMLPLAWAQTSSTANIGGGVEAHHADGAGGGVQHRGRDARAVAAEAAVQNDDDDKKGRLAEENVDAPTSTRGLVSYDDL